ncbi:HsdM family class I SAM-dependent methyltransferase [Mucilaginibacter gossypii]|uniref:site-specific DNA-methyltransferase (adenine-specific) n=1 Tax=Mucilaginibacter gossypii TaxID=551996 RepID=A0A1G8B6U9_9SPHI|nr:N-6 DNA methylase [Mucilaginibacter gossypii]SDH28959.1 Type I restriction-modification system, DNA methylase subunit [Mucilaginibacter gossypii]
MLDINFQRFLTHLSFSEQDLATGTLDETTFEYKVDTADRLSVKYILTPTKDDIYREHKSLWNRNRDNVFIAVTGEYSYIINVKEKPEAGRPLKNSVCLKSFDYGVNSIGFEGIAPSEISKQYIDSAFFFDFVSKNQRKGQEVDKDLLLNLLQLKTDLINDTNEEVVHLLILRCIFIKYLEDRGIFEADYLLSILKSGDPQRLIGAFDEIKKINGDVFKYDDFKAGDLLKRYLTQLALFFETDYRSGQHFLFPYQFDRIPIQLISHVYEAFLKDNSKRRKGIYYTPSFLVEFMLRQVFDSENKGGLSSAKCLDAAVGSGAFLVECFKSIQASFGRSLTFDEKKFILENQLYGIDVDRKALQITAFSLYLALLETEDPEFIRHEIKHAHPILPSLIGKTLIHGNAITDEIFPGMTFEYIVSNPPWGSVPKEEDVLDEQEAVEIRKERKMISNKGKGNAIYASVSDFERSQAFLLGFRRWSNAGTRIVAVVKNSIFLNDNASRFRADLLSNYGIEKFYELSHYNKILFKKKPIGSVNGETIELGASEPCAVIVMVERAKGTESDNHVAYCSPKLSNFSEKFELIHFTSRDIFSVKQQELMEDDRIWKVLVNSDMDGLDVIKKLLPQNDLVIEARTGFQPKSNMASLGDPIWRKLVEPQNFGQFESVSPNGLEDFNWNQGLHRRREADIFEGNRIIVPVRPLKSDAMLFRGAIVSDNIVHKDNILAIKFADRDGYIDDYLPYLAIINSQLIGFLFYQLSIQWGKGEGKRDTLRNIDLEKLPIKVLKDDSIKQQLRDLVLKIQSRLKAGDSFHNESQLLNDIVFAHYGLLDYEKEVIKEFYQVNVDHAAPPSSLVTGQNMSDYFDAFAKAFSLVLAPQHGLAATYNISLNMGSVICLRITSNDQCGKFERGDDRHIINFVKNGQLKKADALKILEEDKVKLYEKDKFYIIKSNQFKDWTVRQAIVDAKEEIEQFIKHLA